MFFDSDDTRKNHESSRRSATQEELEQAGKDFDMARMLMEEIAQKGSHSQEDFDRMDELHKEMECALLVMENDKEEKLQQFLGFAYEMFIRIKKLAAEGDPICVEAWNQLKPSYEKMLSIWMKGRGDN